MRARALTRPMRRAKRRRGRRKSSLAARCAIARRVLVVVGGCLLLTRSSQLQGFRAARNWAGYRLRIQLGDSAMLLNGPRALLLVCALPADDLRRGRADRSQWRWVSNEACGCPRDRRRGSLGIAARQFSLLLHSSPNFANASSCFATWLALPNWPHTSIPRTCER
jgi:hypothetical protein